MYCLFIILALSEVLFNCIDKSDADFRKTFYRNIVLAGGTTLTTGFPERLFSEVTKTAPSNTEVKMVADQERHLSAWQGGSVLCSLSSFDEQWLTAATWEEEGERAVLRCE